MPERYHLTRRGALAGLTATLLPLAAGAQTGTGRPDRGGPVTLRAAPAR
ncbi:MAG: hypothetical protein JWQ36_1910, partial [Enterovirga sp.]|nr:hypothetical protein [Enterovirga sp.]